MQITITGRHLEVPALLEELLTPKLTRLERFGHKIMGVHAIFGREKYLYLAEFTLNAKGFTLAAKASHPHDLLGAAEEALDKLTAQLKTREEKRIERQRRKAPHRP